MIDCFFFECSRAKEHDFFPYKIGNFSDTNTQRIWSWKVVSGLPEKPVEHNMSDGWRFVMLKIFVTHLLKHKMYKF